VNFMIGQIDRSVVVQIQSRIKTGIACHQSDLARVKIDVR
jgi:hypothetical protein